MFVKNYLTNKNVHFICQKQFPELVSIAGFPLSYDFYLPHQDLLIEINGLQHYKPVNYFGGKKQFAKQQEHDKRKREFAKNNGFELLELQYFGVSDLETIKKVLDNKLSE